MTVVDTLYRLQQRDLRLDSLRRRAQDVRAAMHEPASVLSTRSTSINADKTLHTLQTRLRDAELERQTLIDKIKAEETRLYSGRVTNVKEMTNLEQEIVSLKKRLARLDDNMLELMLNLETAQADQDEATRKLVHIEKRWSAHLDGLRTELTTVESELAELTVEVDTLRATLPPNDLVTYDRLRQQKSGRAVVRIDRSRCEGCQVALPMLDITRAREGVISFCSHCGRILYAG